MRRLALILLFALPLACAHQPGTDKKPVTRGRGEVTLTVTPNPVLATNAGGTMYDFPFDVVIKETGGHPVTIDRVIANVYAGGGISVATKTFDAEKIKAAGFSTTIAAKGEVRYHFSPREDVPDDRLFSSVYGDVRVEAIDDNGTRASANTMITVKKK
jgi:hypothetical protein